MLYDNALLALAYTEAFQHTRRPLYEQAARRTLDYMLRELSGPQGGFCCGQDADSGGVEGKYYTMTPDELAQVLGREDADRFCRWYGITPWGNFEDKSIPNLLDTANFDREPEGMAGLRERVYAYRLGRTELYRDDKVLTAWNGLALAALARAELAERLLELFFDWVRGGFYPYSLDGEQLLTRTKEAYDGAIPSGNSVAALVLSRLARLTGEGRWREAAKLQLSWLAGVARDYPAGHSFAILAFEEELWPTAELVVAAQNVPEELCAFLRETPCPELTVLVKTPASAGMLAALAPFVKDYPIPERGARYYLCQNGTCAQPVDTVTALRALFAKSG